VTISGDDVATQKQGKKLLPWWQEAVLLLVIALLVAIVIKTFFLQMFWIPSPSMVPGLVVDDRVLVEKPSYWFGEPQRGDVVVFDDPGGWLPAEDAGPTGSIATTLSKIGLYPAGGHLVKRVIGVPGDTIVCCDDQGRLSVNGQPLDEDDYVNDPDTSACRGPAGPGGADKCSWTIGPIPDGKLFVMGDNRYESADSSAHMCPSDGTSTCVPGNEFVDEDLVVGRVFAVVWPRDHLTRLHRPDTFSDVPDS
jgi:signal peptidase I